MQAEEKSLEAGFRHAHKPFGVLLGVAGSFSANFVAYGPVDFDSLPAFGHIAASALAASIATPYFAASSILCHQSVYTPKVMHVVYQTYALSS